MKLLLIVPVMLLFVMGAKGQTQVQRPSEAASQPQVQRFSVDGLLAEMQQRQLSSLDFLKENTVHGRICHIVQGRQDTARYDLVIIVLGGEGMFSAGAVERKVGKGALVFVPKDSLYRWSEVVEPMDVMEWVSLGYMKSTQRAEPGPEAFTLEGVGRERLPGGNAWNAFIRCPSMVFGLYMLPKRVGGDSALTHTWDEINLITAGTGKFQVGKEVMEVRPGDIVYVRKGNPHFFHSLQQDMDILIFFEMKSMEGW